MQKGAKGSQVVTWGKNLARRAIINMPDLRIQCRAHIDF